MKLYPTRRVSRALADACVFEKLEIRSMMSVVNVADYGARPNDGANDLPAIQAAMNASRAGDTILFDGGVFDLSGFGAVGGGNGLKILTGRTYQGQNGAILRGKDSKGPQLQLAGNDVTITGLKFDGGGVKVDGVGGMAQNIVIDNNAFFLNTTGENPNGITMNSGLRNSKITNNYFTSNLGGFGIYGYNYNGLTIANNEFVNIAAGMHIDAFGNSGNLLVEQNYFSGLRGMGMEFQTQGGTGNPATTTNLTFQDNWFENPNLSSQGPIDKNGDKDTYDPGENPNANSMAFSLILDRGSNITIRRNTVLAPQRPDGIGCRIGFEVGGDNTLVEDNYVNGINQVLAVNDGHGTTSVTVRNNKFMNYRQGPALTFPKAGRTWTNINNGANTTLTWDINRARPGIGSKRFGSTPAPAPSTPAPDNSLPSIPAEKDVTYLSDIDWVSMKNHWGTAERDKSNGEKLTGDGRRLSINGVTFAKGLGVHAGSEIHYDLSGKYSKFKTEIGMDDEVGNKGSVVFQVYFDGNLVYDSTKLTGSSSWQFIDMDVTGVQDLGLVVTDAGDGVNHDHADWGNARLIELAEAEPAVSTPDPNTVNLSDLIADFQSSGWGPIELDASNGDKLGGDGRVMTLNGVTYETGIGVHSDSSLVFNLDGKYVTFSSDIGVDDEVGARGSVVFQVILDGDIVFTSGVMTGASETESVNVNVADKQTLELVVTSPDTSANFDHADWAGAQLSLTLT